jgi:putative DNA methylase
MTIPKDCKRLAEVDFPIAEVSEHAIREKPVVHKHPQSLHQWWARRPLASSRAVLMALLLPDPLDPLCPAEFKSHARKLLSQVQNVGNSDLDLRAGLLRFIGDFSNWDLASNQQYINTAKELVKAVHQEIPLVVDPFSGGGSIPLEALRVGCDSYASELNLIAGINLKTLLEDLPQQLIQDAKEKKNEPSPNNFITKFRIVATEIKERAKNELTQEYPLDTDGSKPIAYLWARTVRCESPHCGAEIPLTRSFWLCKKAHRRLALRPKISPKTVTFEVYTPKSETDIHDGTIKRAKATCLVCGNVLPAERVRAQFREQNGGAEVVFDQNGKRIGGARLLAIVTLKPKQVGRYYRLPIDDDYKAIWQSQTHLKESEIEFANKFLISAVPNETVPLMSGVFNIPIYGMNTWGDIFTARQKLSLITIAKEIASSNQPLLIRTLIAFINSRLSDRLASLVSWDSGGEKIDHVFKRQALPMIWDFAEGVPFADATGSFENILEQIEGVIYSLGSIQRAGQVHISDARSSALPDESTDIWFTDPPYYFAVPYADLSDYFFVWMKRCLPDHPFLKDPYDITNPLTNKALELCEMAHWDSVRYPNKDKSYFEDGMRVAFEEGRRVLKDNGIGCVVFAHKTTEGWEALLSGMVRAGWVITASWPIATEREGRMRARESAALATSVHLICRPRSENAEIGDWIQVSRELPRKVGDWMQRLQGEGVRGADLVFACIGPALEIYSRYSKVVDAEDREIPLGGDPEAREPHLRGYLAYVWEVVGRLALEQVLGTPTSASGEGNDGVNALEEDARLTALFLWTKGSASPQAEKPKAKSVELEEEPESEAEDEEETAKKKSKGGFALPYDVVRRIAQPLGIHLPEWEHRIIETDKGVVTLLSVKDRARQLFGEEGASSFASDIESNPTKSIQMSLFQDAEPAPKIRAKRKSKKDGEVSLNQKREATTLDRLHAAMLLQKGGQTTALRALLQSESERGSDFMRLANALSALYPRESEEKRLVDALLVNVRR